MPNARILVVDDDKAVHDILAAQLQLDGYQVDVANDVESALEALTQGQVFDLVLCDIIMPGTDGLSLLRRIYAEHGCTPVVMVTAVQDVNVAAEAFRAGAIDLLLKPFTRSQLQLTILRGLEHRRLSLQSVAYRQNLEEMVASRTQRLRETMQELERSYDITLEAMAVALDMRDEETEGHSKRVTAYTIQLGRELGLNSTQLRTIARGAFLHDIGKIAIPDAILLKPGRLNEEEMAVMRQHCERGFQIVSKIEFLQEARDIVLSHHERFDGKGYPRGLSGQSIPLGARLFAIADTMDAMTSDRPYRKGTSFEAARDEILKCSGGQFDPALVDLFLQIPLSLWQEIRNEIATLAPDELSLKLCRPEVASPLRSS
ncbi:MAG: response regulator [Acidobacteriota bacterium]|nr:response regulator [Acidobacteriota bacterium]